MKKTSTLFALSTACGLFVVSGCDYMPEALSGRPSQNTVAVSAVGPDSASSIAAAELQAPNHSYSAEINVESGADANGTQNMLPPSLNVVPATQASMQRASLVQYEAPAQDGDVQLPPNAQPQMLETATPAAQNSYGVYRSTESQRINGKIVLQNANLKFVDDLEIAAHADGIITKLEVKEGDIIQATSNLVEIDARLADAEVQVAAKELEAAAEKAKDTSEIAYSKAASEVADQELKTSKDLLNRGAETDADHRKKWLEAKRASLAIIVADLKHNQDMSAVGVNEAKKHAADVQLELRSIKAPFTGMIAEKMKDQHDWVRSGDTILRLVALDKVRVMGLVHASTLQSPPHMLLGAPASVGIEVFPGNRQTVNGVIGFVSPIMDASGSYKVWLEVANVQDRNNWLFREGMPATITISDSQ